METEAAAEEASAEPVIDKPTEGGGADKTVVADEVVEDADDGNLASEDATRDDAAGSDEGSGDRTDGAEASGAPGATPATEPSAAATLSASDEPQPSAYVKAGENIFISLPWASGSRAPVEGEVFDGEVLAAAGLTLVDAPSTSSNTSEEERLLQKLVSLYRARQEKLASREALAAKAAEDIEKRAEELRSYRQGVLQSLAEGKAQLAEEQKAFLLAKAEVEEQQRLSTEELSAREGKLAQWKVELDSHEEDHVATKAAKEELEVRVAKLEAALKTSGEELLTLKEEREKGIHSLAELQVAMADKREELNVANNSIGDLNLKLATLTQTLDDTRKREQELLKEIHDERALLESAATTQNTFRDNVMHWTESLVKIAADIDRELVKMGVQGFGYSPDEGMPPSAKLHLFFKGVVMALRQLQDMYPKHLAEESRRLCAGVLRKVLMKVAFRNPNLRLTNVLASLP
ncbi:hypothetical protein ACQJBY_022336 [Aegilops geniculata]